MPQNGPQQSVNNISTGIVDNLTGMEFRLTTTHLLAALIGKNRYVNMESTSNNSVPTLRQSSEHWLAINCVMLFLMGVLLGQLLQSVLEFNFTNMHEMSC
jgi:hypothetical protein